LRNLVAKGLELQWSPAEDLSQPCGFLSLGLRYLPMLSSLIMCKSTMEIRSSTCAENVSDRMVDFCYLRLALLYVRRVRRGGCVFLAPVCILAACVCVCMCVCVRIPLLRAGMGCIVRAPFSFIPLATSELSTCCFVLVQLSSRCRVPISFCLPEPEVSFTQWLDGSAACVRLAAPGGGPPEMFVGPAGPLPGGDTR
jgi:hypothetical protein